MTKPEWSVVEKQIQCVSSSSCAQSHMCLVEAQQDERAGKGIDAADMTSSSSSAMVAAGRRHILIT